MSSQERILQHLWFALCLLLVSTVVDAQGLAWSLLSPEQREQVAAEFSNRIAAYIDESASDAQAEREQNQAQIQLLRELDRLNRNDGSRESPAARELRLRLYGPTEAERIAEQIRDGRPRRRHSAEARQLRDLLVDLEQPEASWQRRYAQQYGRMLLSAGIKDLKRFSTLAGEISAGEYGKVRNVVAEAGTALFKQAVGDALENFGFDQTKSVFDALIANADDVIPLARNFLRGEWGQLMGGLRALGTKKLKEASREAIAGTVGWAFGPLGGVVGPGYVAALESEVAFLEWGRRTLDRKATRPCLELYVQKYRSISPDGDSDGAAIQAFDEFKQCSERTFGAFGFRALEDFIREKGLDANAIYLQMAEGYRRGEFQFAEQWLAEQVETRKQTAESALERDLTAVQQRMDAVGGRFNRATTEVLNDIIAGVLGEARISELEEQARKALVEAGRIAALIRRAQGGVLGNCGAFRAAATAAERTLADAALIENQAGEINVRLKNFAGCKDGAALAALQALDQQGADARRRLADASAAAEQSMRSSCQLRESISVIDNREDARAQLDAINAQAADAQRRVADGQAAIRALKDAAQRAAQVPVGGDAEARAELDALIAAAQALPFDLAPLEQALELARGRMARQLRSARNLESFAIEQARRIKPLLDPHRGGTLRAQVLQLEDEVAALLEQIADCQRDIATDWQDGGGHALPWRIRKPLTPEFRDLSAQRAAAAKRCPSLADDPMMLRQQLIVGGETADTEGSLLDGITLAYQRCVAEAVASYEGVRTSPQTTDEVDPAKAVLTRSAVVPDALHSYWKTVADGTVVWSLYEGDANVTGTITWASPPASIGPEGFSITLNVQCKTGKLNRLASGVGMSGEDFDFVVSAADRTPIKAEAPANCEPGDSRSGSVTVHVLPRSTFRSGDRAKLRIGAFWGLGVTYEYVAR